MGTGSPLFHSSTVAVAKCCRMVSLYTLAPGLIILASFLHSTSSICFINKCQHYIEKNQAQLKRDGACGVIFDENCCKESKDHYVIPSGQSARLCKKTSLISKFVGASKCKGPIGLNDDAESILVMPGCKLEVWDDKEGFEEAAKAEAKSKTEGLNRDNLDRNNQNKITLEALDNEPNFIEELNDNYDDLNEDISSFRCTCK